MSYIPAKLFQSLLFPKLWIDSNLKWFSGWVFILLDGAKFSHFGFNLISFYIMSPLPLSLFLFHTISTKITPRGYWFLIQISLFFNSLFLKAKLDVSNNESWNLQAFSWNRYEAQKNIALKDIHGNMMRWGEGNVSFFIPHIKSKKM